MKIFEQTGERFIPTQSNPTEVIVNLDRFSFAMDHCINKDVLELGFGSGLGAYLYHLVAKKYTGIDYNDDAFEHIKLYPFNWDKVELIRADLESVLPSGAYDTVIATEFLEHLEDPTKILKAINTQAIVFSLPLASMAVSKWHKFPIRDGQEGVKDIHKMFEDCGYHMQDLRIQADRWVLGYAFKNGGKL